MSKKSKNNSKNKNKPEIFEVFNKFKNKRNRTKKTRKKQNNLFNKIQKSKKLNKNYHYNLEGGVTKDQKQKTKTLKKNIQKLEVISEKIDTIKKNIEEEEGKVINKFIDVLDSVNNIIRSQTDTNITKNHKRMFKKTLGVTGVHNYQGKMPGRIINNIRFPYLKKIYRFNYPMGYGRVYYCKVNNYDGSRAGKIVDKKLRFTPKHFYKVDKPILFRGRERKFKDNDEKNTKINQIGRRAANLLKATRNTDKFVGSKIARIEKANKDLLHIKIAKYRERELQFKFFKTKYNNVNSLISADGELLKLNFNNDLNSKYKEIKNKIENGMKETQNIIGNAENKTLLFYFLIPYEFYNIHAVIMKPPKFKNLNIKFKGTDRRLFRKKRIRNEKCNIKCGRKKVL